MVNQTIDTVGEAASRASEWAQGAFDQGQQVARSVGERYPEARRSLERGTRAVSERITDAPLMALLAAGRLVCRGLDDGRPVPWRRALSLQSQGSPGPPWSAHWQTADRERPRRGHVVYNPMAIGSAPSSA